MNTPQEATYSNGSSEARQDLDHRASRAEEPVSHLFRKIVQDIPTLVQKEIALARAEIREGISGLQAGVTGLIGGAVLTLAGTIYLLLAAVYALSNVMAPWLSALVVGGAVLLVGLIMISSGRKKLRPAALTPERAIDDLKKDSQATRRAVQ